MPSQLSATCTVYIYFFSITFHCTLQALHAKCGHLFVIVLADTWLVKAPHPKETCAKLVEQLDYSRNLHFFTLRTDNLCLPCYHSWTSSCTFQSQHLLALCNCFRSYFIGESVSPKRIKCQIGGTVALLQNVTFLICGQMAYLSRIYLFMNYQLHIRSHHLLALFGFFSWYFSGESASPKINMCQIGGTQ